MVLVPHAKEHKAARERMVRTDQARWVR
jgi:hypothetical protein